MCHGRRLLDLIAVGLCAALLMDKAAADIASGDARKAVVAGRIHRAAAGAAAAPRSTIRRNVISMPSSAVRMC